MRALGQPSAPGQDSGRGENGLIPQAAYEDVDVLLTDDEGGQGDDGEDDGGFSCFRGIRLRDLSALCPSENLEATVDLVSVVAVVACGRSFSTHDVLDDKT